MFSTNSFKNSYIDTSVNLIDTQSTFVSVRDQLDVLSYLFVSGNKSLEAAHCAIHIC